MYINLSSNIKNKSHTLFRARLAAPEVRSNPNYHFRALSLERGGSFLDWGRGEDGMRGRDEGETDEGEGESGGKRFS